MRLTEVTKNSCENEEVQILLKNESHENLSDPEDQKDINEERKPTNNEENESEIEMRNRVKSFRILNVVGFTFSVSFSIILTGAFPYLKELMPNKTEEQLLFKYGIVV